MRQSKRPIIKNKDHIACTPPLIHAINNNHLRCMSQMKKKNDYVIDERKFKNNYITFLLMDKKSSNLPIDG
jgi:hypothetical protein